MKPHLVHPASGKHFPPKPYSAGETTCHYCNRQLEGRACLSQLMATRDHLVPRSKGGTAWVWCCYQCNQLKGGMDLHEWETFMFRNPEWWEKPEFRRSRSSVGLPGTPRTAPPVSATRQAVADFLSGKIDRIHPVIRHPPPSRDGQT